MSFHARHLSGVNERVQAGDVIIARDVIINQGQGYSASTGHFTAPISGVYFFMASTGPYHNDDRYTLA